MSLATTCPTCATVFRVVEDQLKVSEGWVRCGQCQQVFNALEGLFDLSVRSRPGPLTWSPTQPVGFEHDPAPTPARASPGEGATGSLAGADAVTQDATLAVDAASGNLMPSGDTESAPRSVSAASREFFAPETTYEDPNGYVSPSARLVDPQAGRDDPSFDWAGLAATPLPDARPASVSLEDGSAVAHPPGGAESKDGDELASRWAGLDDAAQASPSEIKPAFVRDAERRERWRRPGVRLAMGVMSALLGLLLVGQAAFQWRDRLAASQPAFKPVLAVLCGWVGCELQAPRVLDALVVDNTTVSRSTNGTDAYRLAVQLRNRADYAVASPYLELNLTDSQGKVIVRRVLKPEDFRVADRSIAAQSESTWALDFASGQRRITGYTVAAFYP